MASGINERFERVLAHLDSVGDHYQPQKPASVTHSLMADFDNCAEPTQEGPMAPSAHPPFSVRGGEGARASTDAPSLPKMASFDARPVSQGGMRWKAFHLQFECIAGCYRWSEATRHANLVLSLRGAALDFYADLPEEDRASYRALVTRLKARFGREELPLVKRLRLQEMQQTPGEDLDAFAERVLRLAYGAYEGLRMDREAIETIAVDVFLMGCLDREAAATVMNHDPHSSHSMDHTLRLLHTVETTNRVLARRHNHARTPGEVPRVHLERCPEPRVQKSTVREEMRSLKEEMSTLGTGVSEIRSLLKSSLPALSGHGKQRPMMAFETPSHSCSPSPALN